MIKITPHEIFALIWCEVSPVLEQMYMHTSLSIKMIVIIVDSNSGLIQNKDIL